MTKTEQALLNQLEDLQNQLKNCQDPKLRNEIQKTIDENFLTLGMLYHAVLFRKRESKNVP